MADCALCRVDHIAADDATMKALYFVVGAAAGTPRLCKEHERSATFAAKTLEVLATGTIGTAAPARPGLRLVSTSATEKK
jgi:hypothetical protein